MMKKNRDIVLLLVLPVALLATACTHATSKPQTDLKEVRLEGEITKGEFGCVQVKTSDGQRYSLARDLEGSQPGQHVWVEGYMVKTKGCMPGLSLMPRRAGLVGTAVANAEPVVAGSGR